MSKRGMARLKDDQVTRYYYYVKCLKKGLSLGHDGQKDYDELVRLIELYDDPHYKEGAND